MTKSNTKRILKSQYPEFGVDSRYSSNKQKRKDGKQLLKSRLEKLESLPNNQIVKAKLLQLKFRIEEYLKEPVIQEQNAFSHFLSNYVDTLYDRRNKFAKDLNITPVVLSQILNNHRKPKEEFLLKLVLHSQIAYANVSQFSHKTWFEVYYHQKISDTLASKSKWLPKMKKEVSIKNSELAVIHAD